MSEITAGLASVSEPLNTLFGRRPRLLVVDDQPANIQVIYRTFEADHQVFMATGGEQALKLAAERQPDLVLLDVMMPGIDGLEVCARLKADDRTRDIPVIFVTARSEEADETRGLDAGAVDFISKPINPRIVRARVRTHLTLKRQADLLREWVYIDGLTGVHNRRAFEERLAAEWSRATRSPGSLSLMLFDVDQFKRYNDHYGHQAGDECLQKVAAALKSACKRSTDLVARYGGEEFVVLLPETDAGGAHFLGQAMCDAVRAIGIEHLRSDVAPVVTVSGGLCTRVPTNPGAFSVTAMQMLQAADALLYEAKAGGRNRVVSQVLDAD